MDLPIALTPKEQTIAARTRKTRKFFVFLREHRHELLDADFQHPLAHSYSPELAVPNRWRRGCWLLQPCCRPIVTSAIGTRSS